VIQLPRSVASEVLGRMQRATIAAGGNVLQRTHRRALATCCAAPSPVLQEYVTLAQPVKMESEVKKSRFVTWAWPCSSPSEALALMKQAADPGASHNCWGACCVHVL
jgi:hypothetical protein